MIRGLWDRDTVAWLVLAAALPVAAATLGELGAPALGRFAISLLTVLFWQAVFFVTRAQPISPIAGVTALAVALLAPGTTEPWQLVLAVSFGTVIGEQVFGGWGRNVVNAGVAALSFLYFAFPETLQAGTGGLVALSVLPAALLLVATGIVSWQALVAALVALALATLALGEDPTLLLTQGSLAFGLVFLVCDPVASAATRPGRWVHGALAGGLLALFAWTDAGVDAPHAVVYAALLSSLFAPLIDAGAIAVVSRPWRRHNG